MRTLVVFLASALFTISCSDSGDKDVNFPGCDDGCGDGILSCGLVTIDSPKDMEYFTDCDSIEGDLHIRNLDLTNLNGLSGLRRVTGILHIENNSTLSDLSGLATLETLGEPLEASSEPNNYVEPSFLRIEDNPNLPNCESTRLRDRLIAEGWEGTACIAGNLEDECADDFSEDC